MTTYHLLWVPTEPMSALDALFGVGETHSLVSADTEEAAKELHQSRNDLAGQSVKEYVLIEEITPSIAQEALDNGVTSVLVGVEDGEAIFDETIVLAVAAQ